MSLFDILGVSQDAKGYPVVAAFLKANYIENQAEKERMAHAWLLDEFYKGRGDAEMRSVVEKMYKNQKNRERRLAVIDAGLEKYDNIVARIVNEKATVYSEPARRTVSDEAQNRRYQDFQIKSGQDGLMRELDRKLALHEAALIWYRVRELPTGQREPVLETISPASFWAVCHPNDRTMLVAIIFDQRVQPARPEAPSFRVWTDDQTFVMNGKCEIDPNTIESWPLGQMPGVLASMVPPNARQSLLEQFPNADLLSAQKGIRLQAINLAKESISAVNQTYITGDTSATTMGQQSDTESEVFLGEGVTATTLDRGMDQEQFRDNGGYIGDAVAANHGLAPSVLRHRDASSGAEIELRMLPIRTLRKQRIPVLRDVERRMAAIISLINGDRVVMRDDLDPVVVPGDLQEFAFSMDGWSIDFGEIQQVMTESERDSVFETRRRLGLTDNYEEEMRRNPDIRTIDEAMKVVDARLARQTTFVREQKELMALNGSLGSSTDENTPQQNGTIGRSGAPNGRARFGVE